MRSKKIHSPIGGTFGDSVVHELKVDEAFRELYLKDLLTEKDLPMLALCLKHVVEALGGVGKLSKETGLSRTNLYKALSGKQRPDFSTLLKILEFAGYELTLQKKTRSLNAVEAREAPRGYSVKRMGKKGS